MARYKHELPSVVNPEGDICYPLFIPNHPDYVKLIVRQLRQLTLDRMYERDEDNTALIVREQWNTRMYQPFIDALYDSEPCQLDTLGECYRLDTATEAFSFYPNDPFISAASEDPVVLGMTWRRWESTDVENTAIWQTIEDIFNSLTGYYPNDCMLFPTELTSFAFSSWLDLVEYFTLQVFPFPYVHFELEGHGQFEIELVNVPFGGSALIVPDADILSWQGLLDVIIEFIDLDGELPPGWVFTEVDRDISIPPETAATQTQEIEFEEEGQHSVTVVFIPRLDDELPFFFPFGGIREIEVCGNLSIIGSQTGEQINKENAGLAQHIRQGVIPMGTTEEFYDALIRYETEKANRWLFASSPDNIQNDVEINKTTGAVSIKGALGGGGAVDGTIQELHYGGVSNQAIQFKKLFDDMNSNIDSGYIVDTVINLSRLFTNAVLGNWTVLVGDYFTDDPELVIDASALALHIFCHGYANGALAYALAEHGSVEADVNTIVNFVAEIPSTTWDSWYDVGSKQPKSGYQSATCYRVPDQLFEFTGEQLENNDSIIGYIKEFQVAPRNKRLNITGNISFSDGSKFDGVYIIGADNSLTQAHKRDIFWRKTDSLQTTSQLAVNISYSPTGYGISVPGSPSIAGSTYFDSWQVSANALLDAKRLLSPTGKLTISLIDLVG